MALTWKEDPVSQSVVQGRRAVRASVLHARVDSLRTYLERNVFLAQQRNRHHQLETHKRAGAPAPTTQSMSRQQT
jgi:hypothetical protein